MQDVLCFSGEGGGDAPTVAEARGAMIAAFLCDMIRHVSGGHAEVGNCAMESPRAAEGGGGAVRRVLTLATAVALSSLHPILAQPLMFGCSKLDIQCDTCEQLRKELAVSWISSSMNSTARYCFPKA